MRVAVVLTGQPRYLEQSAWWWKNKVFPSYYQKLQVDYFCQFWQDNTDNLHTRIIQQFNPTQLVINNYHESLISFRQKIQTANENCNDWHLVPVDVRRNVCFYDDEMSEYGYNFHGMFLSNAYAAREFGELTEYDVIIKTRSDAVFNPLSENQWLSTFHNMLKNPTFNETIFSPWLRIKQGAPFFGDLAFIGKPKLMYQFMNNMDEHMFKMCTRDKHLFGELLINDYKLIAHWMWHRLSLYSKTNWLSVGVVWPTSFNVTLIRHNEPVTDKTFDYLVNKFNEDASRRNT
jgi:hypothetical protein